jgi:mannose-1-phosphate guanylyltransferase
MKAFLLAAGYGTRLKPLTDNTAKCLIPVKGVPVLAWWFQLLSDHGINEVLINSHYLADQVTDFVNSYNAAKNYGAKLVYEEVLLGSGGTVRKNKGFIGEDKDFFICYADNLTDINLGDMYEFHKAHNGILTMALFRTNLSEQCGIAELDDDGRIIDFEEKPAKPKSNLANAGVYVANRRLFDYLADVDFSDFGKDVLPKLTGQMYGYEIKEYLIDIGTVENYQKAEKEWKGEYRK